MLKPLKNWIVEKLASLVAAVLGQAKVQRLMDQSVRRQLDAYFDDPGTAKLIWKHANLRPKAEDTHWAALPNSIREWRMIEATREAGKFIQENIPHLEGHANAYDTLSFALDSVTVDGLYLEFGVFSGATINHIADQITPREIHGFDSFEGLPESWGALAKGTFDTGGVFPEVRNNVTLHQGWFDQSIPPFLEKTAGPAAFIHADADLYSSTNTILNSLAHRIVPGTIIVFDELINYPYWRDNEYKSLLEFAERYNAEFSYIAYTDRGYSVAIRIDSIKSTA